MKNKQTAKKGRKAQAILSYLQKLKPLYSLCRKKFWYLFPRPVCAFFAQEWREEKQRLTRLSAGERAELVRRKRACLFSFFASVVFHLLFVVGIVNGLFDEREVSPPPADGDMVVKFDILEGMVSSDLDPVYDPVGEVVVDPARMKDKKHLRTEALDSLLKELKSGKSPFLRASVFESARENSPRLKGEELRFQAGLSLKSPRPGSVFKNINSLQVQLWDRLRLSSSTGGEKVDMAHGEMMQVIDSHTVRFRDCYERALLKDQQLSVKAVFFLKLNQSRVQNTKLKLQGRGNPKSRFTLSRCLFRESKALVFAKNKHNVSIRFNLIFGL